MNNPILFHLRKVLGRKYNHNLLTKAPYTLTTTFPTISQHQFCHSLINSESRRKFTTQNTTTLTQSSKSTNQLEPLEITIKITDPEMIDFFSQYSVHSSNPSHQDGLKKATQSDIVETALKIGFLSLKHTTSQYNTKSVQQEVDRMLELLGQQLISHEKVVYMRINDTLKDYFDPNHGRFQDRIQRLINEDGELATIIKSQIIGEDSKLYKQLDSLIGPHSPLVQTLDPKSKQSVVNIINSNVTAQLDQNRKNIYDILSPESPTSPLHRLVTQVRDSNTTLTESVTNVVKTLQSELSSSTQGSMITRLTTAIDTMQQHIISEFSLDVQNSALVRLRNEILSVNHEQAEAIKGLEQLIIRELSNITTQKKTIEDISKRTPLHGLNFESSLTDLISSISPYDMTCEFVGAKTGLIRNCKVGDILTTLGQEHVASGARIIIEAKADQGFSIHKALEEIEIARKNRNASIGVFVLHSQYSPDNMEPLIRYGNDIICLWNPDDVSTNVYVKAAISLARALSVRASLQSTLSVDFATSNLQKDEIADIEDKDTIQENLRLQQLATFTKDNETVRKLILQIDKSLLDIEKQTGNYDEIKKTAESIIASAEKILHRVRISKSRIECASADLEEYMKTLKDIQQNQHDRLMREK